jgi:hypothetical protein
MNTTFENTTEQSMKYIQNLIATLSTIGILAVCHNYCNAAEIKAGDKIAYDATHYISFEWAQNKTNVRLHVSSHNMKTTIEIVDKIEKSEYPGTDKLLIYRFSSKLHNHIKKAIYRDSDTVWIIARLGHMADGAILVDLDKAKIKQEYIGQNFSLSPDGKNIAYTDVYALEGYQAIYINDTMVSPIIYKGNLFDLETGSNEDRIKRGKLLKILNNPQNTYRIRSPIMWDDNSTIECLNPLVHRENVVVNMHAKISFDSSNLTTQTLRIENRIVDDAFTKEFLAKSRKGQNN